MTRMDWSKVAEQDARRRNAPVNPIASRFIMRAKFSAICHGCQGRYQILDPITPVPGVDEPHWVHWDKKLTCVRRSEGRTRAQQEHAQT